LEKAVVNSSCMQLAEASQASQDALSA